jgi:hypothetical protein
MLLVMKMVVSGVLIGVINMVARDRPGLAGALTAFPVVGYMSVVWLWADRRPGRDQAVFLTSMAWALLPTVVVVAAVALLIRLGWHAVPALTAGALIWVAAVVGVQRLGLTGA